MLLRLIIQLLDLTRVQYWPVLTNWPGLDSGSSYSYSPNPLIGSDTGERWQASSSPSGTVSYPTTIRPIYYHQFPLTLAYNIMGGGSPNPPSFTAALFGSPSSQTLTISPTNYWFDSGASWTEVNTLPKSTLTERWSTGQPIRGIITSTKTLFFDYYHQYYVTFDYKVSGGTGYSSPTINLTSFGTAISINSNSNFWVDISSSYSFQNPLTGSNASERWYTPTPNGNIRAPATISITYYHQLNVIFSFTILYGGKPPPPLVEYVSLGTSSSEDTSSTGTSTWVDANTLYKYPQTLEESSDSERWLIALSTNSSILGSVKISPVYVHQYYVTIKQNSQLAGSCLTIQRLAQFDFPHIHIAKCC